MWIQESRLRWLSPRRRDKRWFLRLAICSSSIVFGTLIVLYLAELGPWKVDPPVPNAFAWQEFAALDGYYNGVRNLVPYLDHTPQNGYNRSLPLKAELTGLAKMPPLDPVKFDPFPDHTMRQHGNEYHSVTQCFLDEDETVAVPDVYVYPGLPQYHPEPLFGSYDELGMREDLCFDRFGRYGPYGYSYDDNLREHGLLNFPKDKTFGKLVGKDTEHEGSEKVFEQAGYTNWTGVDWKNAQQRCFEKNKAMFADEQPAGMQRVQRHAFVLRTWADYTYDQHQILAMRAMVSELALKSGGEYDVHLLVHIKNDTIPIWADEDVYQKTLQEAVPREFWNISTLWSVQQMKMYYPGPFSENFANMVDSSAHRVYRSAHFPLQWFSQQHPEYDFFWNWEMDVRYTGHYYELTSKVSEWTKNQPRKGLWERNRRFWIPEHDGTYQNFTTNVFQDTEVDDKKSNDYQQSGPLPIWGPVPYRGDDGLVPPSNGTTPPSSYEDDRYEWGVGEDADLIVFNPIFDPTQTNWVFRNDVTGYDLTLPIPPRRAAIITLSRMSKRLIDTMHEEVWHHKHTMFPEMWPPTVCLHHGLKAVYAPHPVYFDRDWDMDFLNQALNHPNHPEESPFGWGEHNLLGSTFYYNSVFSGRMWRRWLGFIEGKKEGKGGQGGRMREEAGAGRMCLRGMLLHPVKFEKELEN